ncbi:MAG TPA: Gfo/Idh/MocA family oxidoreductase [Verrucomicrobiae bacterium]|nr:Gfo/Idh/MocA family oxidoreductase [Verrucomicrobiae bacterium]
MNESNDSPILSTRREFLKTSGKITAVSAFAGLSVPHVHAAEDNTIRVALIGCGGRGGGAADNALSVTKVPTRLVAMADVFQNKLDSAYTSLKDAHPKTVDVPKEHQFIGFDGYKKAMDCLRPGDVVILTTPLTFRWVHFTYAIEKGLNVFMEKPLTSDGPCSRRMMDLAQKASAKNLKCAVGLMSRHHRPMQELKKRIDDGQIGEILCMRGYRMAAGPLAACFVEKWPGDPTELLWQISVFHSFIWASGGLFNDFYIHHVDHLCWMKNDYPIKAQALGGRHYRKTPEGAPLVDQNFDAYAVEYTFKDGTKMYIDGRNMYGTSEFYFSQAHGTKGLAVVSPNGDYGNNGEPSTIHGGQRADQDLIWKAKVLPHERNPYQNEWNDFVEAILKDQPYNEVPYGVQSSVTCNLGRLAAHTGREMTYDEVYNSNVEYAPNADKFTMDSAAPVVADKEGKYPVPQPGIVVDRDYQVA